jgi:hypothetical protein
MLLRPDLPVSPFVPSPFVPICLIDLSLHNRLGRLRNLKNSKEFYVSNTRLVSGRTLGYAQDWSD